MLIGVGIVFGLIFGFKLFEAIMYAYFKAHYKPPAVYVSAVKAAYKPWKPEYSASASARAVQGVNVTTELSGMIRKIYFTPGSIVQKGTLLVQLNIDPDVAQLHSLQANAEIAKITYFRDKAQYAVEAISKQTLDSDLANMKSTAAQVEQQFATIAQKTIRAPFTGKLGVCNVNEGQFLNTGDSVSTLQALDLIYVDFYVPQQQVAWIKVGLPAMIKMDAYPNKPLFGKVTTVNPAIDQSTRNIEVEATIENPNSLLLPGMFVTVTLTTGKPQLFLTLPQTAVTFNAYGETVYIIKEKGKDKAGKPILVVNQSFVTVGEKRGDEVAILKGVNPGDLVVTAGQLKLKNDTVIAINNTPDNPVPLNPNE